jgi:hypothetical protein
MLFDASLFSPGYELYRVGETTKPTTLRDMFNELVQLVVERNSDFYKENDGKIVKA